MTKITLTRVWKGMKETKFGSKPSVAIKCQEHGDKWLSTFKTTPAMDVWKEGDVVEVFVSEKNGFMNFDTQPNPASEMEERIAKLEQAVFGGGKVAKVPSIQLDDKPEEEDPFAF